MTHVTTKLRQPGSDVSQARCTSTTLSVESASFSKSSSKNITKTKPIRFPYVYTHESCNMEQDKAKLVAKGSQKPTPSVGNFNPFL